MHGTVQIASGVFVVEQVARIGTYDEVPIVGRSLSYPEAVEACAAWNDSYCGRFAVPVYYRVGKVQQRAVATAQ